MIIDLISRNNDDWTSETPSSVTTVTRYNPIVLNLSELKQINYPLTWLILPLGSKEWLSQRLTNPLYGREILDTQLDRMAAAALGIEKVWKITESWPSITKLLLEERNND